MCSGIPDAQTPFTKLFTKSLVSVHWAHIYTLLWGTFHGWQDLFQRCLEGCLLLPNQLQASFSLAGQLYNAIHLPQLPTPYGISLKLDFSWNCISLQLFPLAFCSLPLLSSSQVSDKQVLKKKKPKKPNDFILDFHTGMTWWNQTHIYQMDKYEIFSN